MRALRVVAGLLFMAAAATGQPRLLTVLDGREAFGRFGEAVAGLDFNDDGFADVFVGEPGWNRVHCYFGGAEFDTVPDLVFRGLAGTSFGTAVAAVGDLNGDGIADLAIGAPRDNSGAAGAGRVFVHFGSNQPDTVPDLLLTGRTTGGRFGWAIAGRGDVNRDAGCDLLVGAPGEQRARLFFGGALLDTVPDLVLRDGNGDYFGGAVALPGDVTGDTCGDILVGDYRHTGPLLHGGGCFLHHGGSPPDPNLDQFWEGDGQNRQLGVVLCGPGDLNGDGVNDLVFAGSYAAVVDLHWGGPDIGNPPDLRLSGQRRFGSSLAGGLDLDRDGFDDLLVGADGNDLGVPSGPGYVNLFPGGDPMSVSPYAVVAGEADGDMFGAGICLPGKVDGDSSLEFVVGAPGHDSRGENAGRCYVYSYGSTGTVESEESDVGTVQGGATIVRGVLVLGAGDSRQKMAYMANLRDACGRNVMELSPGANDVSRLAPGVYFVRAVSRELSAESCYKIVITR